MSFHCIKLCSLLHTFLYISCFNIQSDFYNYFRLTTVLFALLNSILHVAFTPSPSSPLCRTPSKLLLSPVSSGPFGAEGRPPERPQTSESGGTALSHFNRPAASRWEDNLQCVHLCLLWSCSWRSISTVYTHINIRKSMYVYQPIGY